MQIQVNTDAHVQGDTALIGWVERELQQRLGRFVDRLTRVEVHLRDSNAGRSGENDKHCVLEARLAGERPVAVHHEGERVAEAFHGAVERLRHTLEHALGRRLAARRRNVEPAPL